MAELRVGGLVLGKGRPCIIVPLTASTPEGLEAEVRSLESVPAQMAEWRVDMMEGVLDASGMPCRDAVLDALRILQAGLGGRPLLSTFRTADEGGGPVSGDAYASLVEILCGSGMTQLVDIEAFHASGRAAELVAAARRNGVFSVASNHDFHATPPRAEIVRRLRFMQDVLDADVLKIAVMPRCRADVLELLAATEEMDGQAARPLITMSMGPLGVVSRVSGQAFGSCATFGANGRSSAPGQMDVFRLAEALDALDGAMTGGRG